MKDLIKMSDEELWKLFPIIIISQHKACWKERFGAEKEAIEKAAGRSNIIRISHIGSTAVPGLIAKPTIDMLLEIAAETDLDELVKDLRSAGYIYSRQPQKPAPHMMFMKGYTPEGFKGQAYHLHVRYTGDWGELYFRDYLIAHPETAKEYGELKLLLMQQYKHNRDVYTEAKGDFIRKITAIAKNIKQHTLMNYQVVEQEEFDIVGIAVRTTNRNGQAQQDIAGLWERFMGENIIEQIPNKQSNDVYCMYTDYESDYMGAYTTILGCKVSSVDNLPEGFTAKHIPASKYRKYIATGQIPASVGTVWGEIWQSEADEATKIDRRYLADFDVYGVKAYNPQQPEVDIYLSIK